jgi:hypothetical protein
MKTYRGVKVLVSTLDGSCEIHVLSTLPRRNSPGSPMDRGMGGTPSRSVRYGLKKNPFPCGERTLVSRIPSAIFTELSRAPLSLSMSSKSVKLVSRWFMRTIWRLLIKFIYWTQISHTNKQLTHVYLSQPRPSHCSCCCFTNRLGLLRVTGHWIR